jgi:hypothetical protein
LMQVTARTNDRPAQGMAMYQTWRSPRVYASTTSCRSARVSVTPSWILAGAAAIVSIWACVKTPVEESVFLRLGRWWVSQPGVSHWLPNYERDVLDGIVEKRLSDGECDRSAKQTDKATRAEKGVSLQRKHLSCLTCD